jgi:hypothetical protein
MSSDEIPFTKYLIFSNTTKLYDMVFRFYPDVNSVRTEGSYVYEEMVQCPKDIKVYTVGPTFAFAEVSS